VQAPHLTSDAVFDRLKPWIAESPGAAVVFDADGTLWSHDVGCMVFDFACENGAFRDEARDSLVRFAEERGIDGSAALTGNDAARLIQKAFYEGRFTEREGAEVQVWAYVGHSRTEFAELAQAALSAGKHLETLHHSVLDLAERCRSAGAKTFIVSASPLWVVEEAVVDLSFQIGEIAAGVPHFRGGDTERVIAPGMGAPLPYGPDKVVAGKAMLNGRPWLAAFGDSTFDLEMMQVARLAGGIGSKAEMLKGLNELPGAIRFVL